MALPVHCPAAYRKKIHHVKEAWKDILNKQVKDNFFSLFLLNSLRGLKITVSDDFRKQQKTYFQGKHNTINAFKASIHIQNGNQLRNFHIPRWFYLFQIILTSYLEE